MNNEWTGRKRFQELGVDDALASYKEKIESQPKSNMGKLGRNMLINLMKEELISFYGISKEELER